MSGFKKITEYKNTLIQRILSKENILKAIYYQDKSFLEKESVEFDKIIYSNVFPFDFIPTNESELKEIRTYVTLSVTDYRPAGKGAIYRAGSVIVRIFTHKDLFQTDYGHTRVDYLASEVDEQLSDERGVGIGKLEFVGMKEYVVNNEYQGVYLQYRPIDFS
ncbi:hypothetical protein [Paenibacillus odorifer]|uniref:hypothetical protein n=1 Tax=Paenibacillus odorifer TaxID=189426 RepID=UPI00096D0C27|nr:hypothetical protein [Paenibacillus odorifer]OME41416.1 hypothetical protein BSK58_14890 [Paenibacillus odorifer]